MLFNRTNLRIGLTCFALVCVSFTSLTAAEPSFDWPHWRGPNRNDVVAEDSHFEAGTWPPKKVAWERNVGAGSTSPIVVAGRLYVMGWEDGHDSLYCLEAATGRELWKVSYPAPKYGRHATGDQGLYLGITSTPEFDPATGLIYTLSLDGELICWDTNAGGRKVWGGNLYNAFGMPRRAKIGRSGQRDYGYTSSPLVHGETLIVEVGSPQGNLMGLNKRIGRRLWTSQSRDQAGHNGGPVPIEVEGVPCVAVHTLDNLLVARLDPGNEGKTVAEYPWQTEWANNITTPAVHENYVLITSGYNHQTMCKLEITLQGARKVWEKPHFSKVCSPVVHDGHIYFVWRNPTCLDFDTGEPKWIGKPHFSDAGSCIVTADDRLILFGKQGDLVLAETARRSPNEYRELARLDGTFRTDAWPHVVLSNGLIFCKDRRGNLRCFQL